MATEQDIGAIYEVIKLIPKGKVASYGQIADLAQLPGRARLVAKLLQTAPADSLPWYRVIRSDGSIATHTSTQVQIQLLKDEGIEVKDGRVSHKDYGWRPEFL